MAFKKVTKKKKKWQIIVKDYTCSIEGYPSHKSHKTYYYENGNGVIKTIIKSSKNKNNGLVYMINEQRTPVLRKTDKQVNKQQQHCKHKCKQMYTNNNNVNNMFTFIEIS